MAERYAAPYMASKAAQARSVMLVPAIRVHQYPLHAFSTLMIGCVFTLLCAFPKVLHGLPHVTCAGYRRGKLIKFICDNAHD